MTTLQQLFMRLGDLKTIERQVSKEIAEIEAEIDRERAIQVALAERANKDAAR